MAQKSVLAYILKSALDEYAEYTVQEIAERFIEGEPELRKIAAHQDHPDRQDDFGMMSGDDKIEGQPTADKLDALQNEFKISVSKEMSEEVLDLCNLSAGVYNKGYDSGISVGEMKKAKEIAYKLQDKGMPCEEIADTIEVDTDTVREWLAEREELLVK